MAAATTRAGSANRHPRSVSRPNLGGIRWDRLSRYALLLVFLVVVLLYIGPARSYIATMGKANRSEEQVRQLEREQVRLEARKRALADPHVVEAEARRLGMVRPGERSFVARNLPRGR
jgi:cell division protein FtsB